MRRPRPLLPPVLALLPALCLPLPALANPAAATPMQRIDLSTEVSRTLVNDLLQATLFIELSERDPARLSQQLSQAMNQASALAKPVTAVRSQTGQIRQWPVYNDRQRLETWRGRAEFQLESRDFAAAAELIARLQGQLQLQHLQFSVSEDSRRSAEQALISEAVQAFRTRAEQIQKAWGARQFVLVHMNLGQSGGHHPRPPLMAMAKMADVEAAPMDLQGGEGRLSLHVSGTIELKP